MTTTQLAGSPPPTARRDWMRTLACADADAVEKAWRDWHPKPAVAQIRGPEAGLVMVRGRVDGTGSRFNLGEATVTRATIRLSGPPLADDTVGSAYVLGSDLDHARAAACFDALLHDERHRPRVLADVIAPLQLILDDRDAAHRADARSTQVDFFTVAREHE